MTAHLIQILGILLIVGFTYLISKNKKQINWKSVGLLFVTQFILAFLLMKTPLSKLVEWSGKFVTWILANAQEGISFVFGDLSSGWSLFFGGLMPIVFISSLVGLLFHFGILQKFVKLIGVTIGKLFNIDTIISVNGVVNMFLGQSDSLFVTQNYLPKAKDSVIFATLVGGFTSISMGVIGVYVGLSAPIDVIILSLPLTVISTFVLTQIIMPSKYEPVENLEITADKHENVFEAMVSYGQKGFKGVIGIAVALMVFISLVALINGAIALIFPSITLESIIGFLFLPFAFLMGVPHGEMMEVAQLLATKLVLNETVAFGMPQFAELSVKAKAMTTIALTSFGGIGSIGIMIGGYSAIAPNRVKTVAKLGVLALLIATLVNLMSAGVVGLFL